MNVKDHAKKFKDIIQKYHLDEKNKAEEISNFLTKSNQKSVSAKEFAKLFAMTEKEAVIFLSFIERGIKFREKNLG